METVVDDIRALLAAGGCDLDAIERTLTDGYAHALSLEAERWRIERRMDEVTSALTTGDASRKTKELVALARSLKASNSDLAVLRALLATLRAHAESVRAAAV